MILNSILLQAGQAEGGSPMQFYIMMALVFVIFYFFMIRPQSKRQKEERKFREEVKVGDKVITSSGVYGKIKEIKDDYFLLEIAENVRIKINKNFIHKAPDAQQPAK